jgi:hypothetical protein
MRKECERITIVRRLYNDAARTAKAAAPVSMLMLCDDAELENLVFVEFFIVEK